MAGIGPGHITELSIGQHKLFRKKCMGLSGRDLPSASVRRLFHVTVRYMILILVKSRESSSLQRSCVLLGQILILLGDVAVWGFL